MVRRLTARMTSATGRKEARAGFIGNWTQSSERFGGRHDAEGGGAAADVRGTDLLEPVQRKILDGKTGHNGPRVEGLVEKRVAQDIAVLVQIADETAREGVAGARWVEDFFQREGRRHVD